VAVVESQPVHRYRPLLNYVGSGEASMASLEKPAAEVVPDGCTWIREHVVSVDAGGPSVLTRDGRRIDCSTLVLCPGLEEDWDSIPGLLEAYAAGWAGSTFVVGTAPRVARASGPVRRPCALHCAARARSLWGDRSQAPLHGVRPLAARGRGRRP
jgi:sulfide:quinone oxidoreductase